KKGRVCGHAFSKTLKRNPSSGRSPLSLAVFQATLQLPQAFPKLLEGTPQSSSPFQAPHLLIQTASPRPVSRLLVFQNPQSCRFRGASKLPRQCAFRTLQICSYVPHRFSSAVRDSSIIETRKGRRKELKENGLPLPYRWQVRLDQLKNSLSGVFGGGDEQ